LPGSLNINAEWNWRETGITISYETWAQLPSDQQFTEGLEYALHFFYGLKRGHNGYPFYYQIYEPVRGQPIPALLPYETRVVRIYLKEYIGKPYPGTVNADPVNSYDFANLYWGNCGKAIFSVYTGGFDLPDPKEAAKAAGCFVQDDPNDNIIYTYHYDRTGSGDSFQQVPCQAH